MKVYLSGPVSGYDLEERRRTFAWWTAWLERVRGWGVVNPLEVRPECDGCALEEVGGHTWSCFMRWDLRAMLTCDRIVLMPGWEASPGARLEHYVAVSCGLEVSFL